MAAHGHSRPHLEIRSGVSQQRWGHEARRAPHPKVSQLWLKELRV